MICNEETELMLEDIRKRRFKLNDWERDFIDSINEQIEETGTLSERQEETLNKIWEKVT